MSCGASQVRGPPLIDNQAMGRGLGAAAVVAGALLTSGACREGPPARASASAVATAGSVADIAAQATSGRRVIVIGLDGADWSLLDDYVARGVMPALGRLVRNGTSGT